MRCRGVYRLLFGSLLLSALWAIESEASQNGLAESVLTRAASPVTEIPASVTSTLSVTATIKSAFGQKILYIEFSENVLPKASRIGSATYDIDHVYDEWHVLMNPRDPAVASDFSERNAKTEELKRLLTVGDTGTMPSPLRLDNYELSCFALEDLYLKYDEDYNRKDSDPIQVEVKIRPLNPDGGECVPKLFVKRIRSRKNAGVIANRRIGLPPGIEDVPKTQGLNWEQSLLKPEFNVDEEGEAQIRFQTRLKGAPFDLETLNFDAHFATTQKIDEISKASLRLGHDHVRDTSISGLSLGFDADSDFQKIRPMLEYSFFKELDNGWMARLSAEVGTNDVNGDDIYRGSLEVGYERRIGTVRLWEREPGEEEVLRKEEGIQFVANYKAIQDKRVDFTSALRLRLEVPIHQSAKFFVEHLNGAFNADLSEIKRTRVGITHAFTTSTTSKNEDKK